MSITSSSSPHDWRARSAGPAIVTATTFVFKQKNMQEVSALQLAA